MRGLLCSLIGGAGRITASRCCFPICPFQITTSPGRNDSKEKSIIHLENGFSFPCFRSLRLGNALVRLAHSTAKRFLSRIRSRALIFRNSSRGLPIAKSATAQTAFLLSDRLPSLPRDFPRAFIRASDCAPPRSRSVNLGSAQDAKHGPFLWL
jgi:hypothetical protein